MKYFLIGTGCTDAVNGSQQQVMSRAGSGTGSAAEALGRLAASVAAVAGQLG
jgi:hypothetical protein